MTYRELMGRPRSRTTTTVSLMSGDCGCARPRPLEPDQVVALGAVDFQIFHGWRFGEGRQRRRARQPCLTTAIPRASSAPMQRAQRNERSVRP